MECAVKFLGQARKKAGLTLDKNVFSLFANEKSVGVGDYNGDYITIV